MAGFSSKLVLVFFLVIGFILRFTAAITHTYSSDELSAINRLNFESFSELIETGVKTGDMHPAGVQVFLVFWSDLFGTNEIIYRLPFVLFGTIAIYLVYLLGKRINEKTGLIAAGIWATLLFPVLQSELARPYSPGLFLSLIVALLAIKLLFDTHSNRKKWGLSFLLGIAFAACMYTHYFAFLFVGFIGVSLLFFLRKETVLPYLVSGLLAVLLFLPHLSVTLYHTSIEGGLQWLPPPTLRWLPDFLFFAFNSSWLVIIPLALITVAGILRTSKTEFSKFHQIFTTWFFGVFILAFILSIYSTPILKFPVMLFAFPFFVILISFFISKLPFKSTWLGLSFMTLIGLSTILEKKLYSNHHFEVFKELADPIMKWHNSYGKQNFVNIMNVSHPNYINYYPQKKGYQIDLDIDLLNYSDNDLLKSTLAKSNKPYCIIGYSGRLTPPYFFRTALEHYPFIIEYKKYTNSAVFLLSRSENNASVELNRNLLIEFPDHLSDWTYDSSHFSTETQIYKSDSAAIYGPQIKLKLTNQLIGNQQFLEFEIKGNINPDAQLTLVISPEGEDGKVINNLKGEPIWIGRDLEHMLNDNSSAYFALSVPENLDLNDHLKIYLWNRNGKPADIENIKIFATENIWN